MEPRGACGLGCGAMSPPGSVGREPDRSDTLFRRIHLRSAADGDRANHRADARNETATEHLVAAAIIGAGVDRAVSPAWAAPAPGAGMTKTAAEMAMMARAVPARRGLRGGGGGQRAADEGAGAENEGGGKAGEDRAGGHEISPLALCEAAGCSLMTFGRARRE